MSADENNGAPYCRHSTHRPAAPRAAAIRAVVRLLRATSQRTTGWHPIDSTESKTQAAIEVASEQSVMGDEMRTTNNEPRTMSNTPRAVGGDRLRVATTEFVLREPNRSMVATATDGLDRDSRGMGHIVIQMFSRGSWGA